MLVWLSIGWGHIVTPKIDSTGAVDAVYVIGPVENRMDYALTLMDEGLAPVLLATTSVDPVTGRRYIRDHCGQEGIGYHVECVDPLPYSTRGEARLLSERAAEGGWDRVAVITSTPHVARTRLLMERCIDAEVLLWAHDDDLDVRAWTGQFVYQSAAWVKTQVHRGC